MSNAAEFLAGTDPLDSNSFLAIESLRLVADGRAEIRWDSVAGKRYIVKFSDDLFNWSALGEPILANGPRTLVTDSASILSVEHRTYRVFLADF